MHDLICPLFWPHQGDELLEHNYPAIHIMGRASTQAVPGNHCYLGQIRHTGISKCSLPYLCLIIAQRGSKQLFLGFAHGF